MGEADPGDPTPRLLAWLRRSWDAPGLAYAEAPEPILGGNATFIYGFEVRGGPGGRRGPLILRLFRRGQQVDAVRAEATVQRTVSELGYPAPRVLLACTDPCVLGAPFLIMQHLPGETLLSGLAPTRSHAMRVNPWRLLSAPGRLRAMPRVIARWQARLHALDPEPLRRAARERGLPPRLLGLDRELEKLGAELRGAPADTHACFASAVDWIQRQRPDESSRAVICHGDFHPVNVLVQEGAVSGVIDWTDALLAPPAFDVAQTRFLFRFAPLELPAALRGAASFVERLLSREFVRAYTRGAKVDLEALDYYEALRILRELMGVVRERLIRAGRMPGALRPSRNPWDSAHQVEAMTARFQAISRVRLALQLLDGELLVIDDGLHHIAHGDDPGQLSCLEDREMPHPIRGHERHARIDPLGRADADHLGGHDLANPNVLGEPALQDHLARVVAFREQSDHLAVLQDHEGSDVPLRHMLQSVENGRVRRDGVDRISLVSE
jgi:aminoglycoside phosphotransferase (APT) family kinase protein